VKEERLSQCSYCPEEMVVTSLNLGQWLIKAVGHVTAASGADVFCFVFFG